MPFTVPVSKQLISRQLSLQHIETKAGEVSFEEWLKVGDKNKPEKKGGD